MKRERGFSYGNLCAAAAVLAILLLLFFLALGRVERQVDSQRALMLKRSVTSAAATCYALEGRYPSDVQYLVDNYGVSIDTSKFIVSYEVFASNLMPSVLVIEKAGD